METENKIRLYAPAQAAIEAREAAPLAARVAETRDVPDLVGYWRVICKRRAAIFTVMFVIFAVGLFLTLKERPVYEARALLEIQKENSEIPNLQELFQVDSVSDSYLETQDRILKSEELARRVISQLHLDRVPEFNSGSASRFRAAGAASWAQPSQPASQPAPQVAVVDDGPPRIDVPDTVLKKFQERLTVEPIKRSRLIEVSFESNDPARAANVVNTLADTYIRQNLEARWQASQKAAGWLSEQLDGMKARLERSEDELQRYARDNGLLFLETDKGTTENIVVQRLRELQDELTKAQADRFQKESMYHLVQQGDYASIPGVFDNKLMQDLTEKLAELQRERSRLASTFNPDYPRMKELQSQIDESQSILAGERERAAGLISNQYRAAVEHESMVRGAFEEQQREANQIAEKSVQYNILKREADTNKQLYVGLLEKLKETGVSTSLKATNIRIVDPAYAPKKPDHPRILLNLCMALLIGLSAGIGAAFLQEHLDNTLKTAEDVERFLQLPALGSVPAVADGRNGAGVQQLFDRARSLTTRKPRPELPLHWNRIEGNGQNAALAEAFHGLRTSVLLSQAKCPPSSLLVTSARAGEGKTTVAANLALSLAQLGESVLLIDADLRRPSLHNFFGHPNQAGIVNYLAGNSDWRKLLWQDGRAGLFVLFSGPAPPNPADLLSSESMGTLIREASAEYRFVVLDSPPLLNLADSRILATLVDGVILVIGGSSTPRDLVHRAYTSAAGAGSHILGATINFADTKNTYYYYAEEKSNGHNS
jgi:polysaccharide biosynthesis transport protein